MHKGRSYPYLDDLWAVETTWWPYWAPRKFWVFFAQPQTDPDWSFITIPDQVTATGIVAANRKSVSYDLVGQAGVWTATLFLFNQFAGAASPIRFNLRILQTGAPPVTNRSDLSAFTGPLTIPQWALSDVIPPWYHGTPVEGGCRPATWSEV